jgi:hypothetical protein
MWYDAYDDVWWCPMDEGSMHDDMAEMIENHPKFKGWSSCDDECDDGCSTCENDIRCDFSKGQEEDLDLWENDHLCLQLNNDWCMLKGRHPKTTDEDWELFDDSVKEGYSEARYIKLAD